MVCDGSVVKVEFVKETVLILILLEYGLRHKYGEISGIDMDCLNPYSIGIWSATNTNTANTNTANGLNPYSIGIWSATMSFLTLREQGIHCLNPYSIGIWSATVPLPLL